MDNNPQLPWMDIRAEVQLHFQPEFRPIRILARHHNGKLYRVQNEDEVVLPNGALVQLDAFVAPSRLNESLKLLSKPFFVPFLPKGTVLYYAVNPRTVTDDHEVFKSWNDQFSPLAVLDEWEPIRNVMKNRHTEFLWLTMTLRQNAWLKIWGDSEARLCPCEVSVGGLEIVAGSLNSAVSMAVQQTQRKRSTTSVNVFKNVIIMNGKVPVLLSWIRNAIVRDFWAGSVPRGFHDEMDYDPRRPIL